MANWFNKTLWKFLRYKILGCVFDRWNWSVLLRASNGVIIHFIVRNGFLRLNFRFCIDIFSMNETLCLVAFEQLIIWSVHLRMATKCWRAIEHGPLPTFEPPKTGWLMEKTITSSTTCTVWFKNMLRRCEQFLSKFHPNGYTFHLKITKATTIKSL